MKLAKFSFRMVPVVFLVASITLNIALLVGGSVYRLTSSAVEAVTGLRTVAAQHADEVADLGSQLVNEKRVSRELRSEVADISDNLISERKMTKKLQGEVTELSGDLAAQRVASKKLRNQLSDTGADLVTYRGKKMARSQAVELTADSISRRAAKTSSRSIGSMAGEAIPYIGTAVIVGVTALELKDLCDTLKDMSELKRSFTPGAPESDDEATVCAMKVPTAQELWEVAKSSPETAWNAAKEATPSLEEIQQLEFPDIDWTAAWATTMEGTENAWAATKDGAGTAIETTVEATSGLWEGAKKYWSDEASDTPDEE